MITKQESRGHSVVGASSADRWMNCKGSNNLIKLAPPQGESSYAAEGTCSHELAEHTLKNSGICADYVGMEWAGHEVTEEMAEFTQSYVDYVTEASKGEHKDLIIEEMFDLDHIREGMFGSNDAIVMEFMGTLEVIDLKYGKGKEVFAKDNKQLMYYALGCAHGEDFKEVKMTIVQPRIQDPIKSHTISMEELEKFGEELGVAVDDTRKEDAPLKAGEHCFFCPAKAICPEQRKAAQELAVMDFAEVTATTEASLPKPAHMDDLTLMNILDHAKDVKKWLESVQAYAKHKAENGGYVKGYKLVRGRANRKIQSETELHMAFGDEIYEKKLLGIGKLEEAFGKKEVAEYLYTPEAGLSLVHHTDKKPEVEVNSTINDFDSIITYDNVEF
jgi:hypothetical protein